MDKLKIFISGTQDDMQPERDAVNRAVNATTLATGIRAEAVVSQPQSPREWIEQQIRDCNIYIGVYSRRYGWVIPEEDRSATEFEFDLATQLKRPILIWIRKLQEQEKSLPDFERQELFLMRVSDFTRGKLRQEFENTSDLEKWVAEALNETFIEIIQKYTSHPERASFPEVSVKTKEAGYRSYLQKLVTDLKEWEQRYAPMFARFEKLDLFGKLTIEDSQPQPLLDLIKQSQRIVVLGAAGAGKTTTLRRIALESAQDTLASERDTLIPTLVSLRDYGPPSIMSLVADKFRGWGLSFENVREDLDSGKYLLIFDGLNEVAAARRDECHNELRHFVETYPNNHYIFTARDVGYRAERLAIDEISPPTCKILPLIRGQIEDYIRRYFREEPEKADGLIGQLRLNDDTAWENREALVHLAEIPLLLQMLILTFEAEGHIPRSRGELLLRFVTDILTKVEPGKAAGQFAAEIKLQLLSAIAWEMQNNGLVSAAPIRVAWETFATRLKKMQDEGQISARYTALDVWQEIQNNNLLVVEEGEVIWPHPLYQELFVGLEVQSICFDSLWRPRKGEIFFRFSPLRAKWFGEPWFEYGIMMLETVPSEYRLQALVAVSGCNPDLVWQAYLRMEPEYHPDLTQAFLEQLNESSLSSNHESSEYRYFVRTIKYFDASEICSRLVQIAQQCPAWEGREEALYAIWAKCRLDFERSAIQFTQSVAMTDSTARVREGALDFLVRENDNKIINFLVERLLAETMEVAEHLLGMMGNLRVDPLVLTRLQQIASSEVGDASRRKRAIWALGESGTSAEPICRLLCQIAREGADTELRKSAVHGLRNFPSRITLNTLKCTLKDADRLIRLASVASLNALAGFNIVPVLISALADDDGEVVGALNDSLVALGGKRGTVNALSKATRANDVKIRRGAFSVLAIVANKSDDKVALSARRELRLLASEKDKESLLEIATGLINHEPQLSTDIFKRLLGDDSEHIREKTCQRVEDLGLSEST